VSAESADAADFLLLAELGVSTVGQLLGESGFWSSSDFLLPAARSDLNHPPAARPQAAAAEPSLAEW
jgi:hypothetical protein